MRESLLKKKLRLASDLKLLMPVTAQIIDIANQFAPATSANARQILVFDASLEADGRRPVVLVFTRDGDCHVIETIYGVSSGYTPDTIPHGLDLAKFVARIKSTRRLSNVAREHEIAVRLFIHFIDAINPKIDRYMALNGAWNEQEPGGPRPDNVKSFQEHLDIIAWSDSSGTISEPFILKWNGHQPSWPSEVISESVSWENEEDFQTFRSSLLTGEWGSLSIENKAHLTERFVAACWCLCWQFDNDLVNDATHLEYNDDDGGRRSGYSLEYSSEPIEFAIRSSVVAEKDIARTKYANWLKRLQAHNSWQRYFQKDLELAGDRSRRSKSEVAALKKAWLAAEAGIEPLPYWGSGLFIPAILLGA